jgi:hypothetical protein
VQWHRNTKLTFEQRVIAAFLLVPWLPLLIAVPYAPAPNFQFFGWNRLDKHLLLCVMVAVFTYLLEAIALVPMWLRMRRTGKTSLLRILTLATLVAFMFGVVLVFLVFGTRFYLHREPNGLLIIICLIGLAEAFAFWLIVRPDKHDQSIDRNSIMERFVSASSQSAELSGKNSDKNLTVKAEQNDG